jgi:hypothetical protein
MDSRLRGNDTSKQFETKYSASRAAPAASLWIQTYAVGSTSCAQSTTATIVGAAMIVGAVTAPGAYTPVSAKRIFLRIGNSSSGGTFLLMKSFTPAASAVSLTSGLIERATI